MKYLQWILSALLILIGLSCLWASAIPFKSWVWDPFYAGCFIIALIAGCYLILQFFLIEKKCTHCKKRLKKGWHHCPHCGQKQ